MSVEPKPVRHKPLGIKAYGSIPHLPNSRMGPADHHCHEGQARICTEQIKGRKDRIIVQEKLDGSCCSVALINGEILALGRAGYLASTSPFVQHHMFAEWVAANEGRFRKVLNEGERLVGEWLAQAHGTRYDLTGREPFVAFDLMIGSERLVVQTVTDRVGKEFQLPPVLAYGPTPVEKALELLGQYGQYNALDSVEGCVWRVEDGEEVNFLAKFVRPDKIDGVYLPEVSGKPAIWNWLSESNKVSIKE